VPHTLKKPSIQLFVLIASMLSLLGFAFSISSSGLSSGDATSSLSVDGVTYNFAPTTCTVSDTDFVASGPGELDGEPFWVSASADRVNLVVGDEADGEVEVPSDASQVWLTSVAEISWTADGQSLTGNAVMRDERDTTARNFRAELQVECVPA
jgi:hypothetical protein